MKSLSFLILICALIFGFTTLIKTASFASEGVLDHQGADLMDTQPENYPIATFGGGCFWCLESEFRGLNGVLFTRVGYMGGDVNKPGYYDVAKGNTGHAEVVEVTFDPEKISYHDLIEFFLTKAHDPTQLNQQGVDKGTQYRSEIFYHDDAQQQTALSTIKDIDARKIYDAPIVTTVNPATTFWMGEDYHQQYYEKYEETNGTPHARVQYKMKKKALLGQ